MFLDAASDSNDEAVRELLDKTRNEKELRSMLTFQDGDMNTALHFGAKNGNLKICSYIVDEATKLGIVAPLVNCCNRKGFSPLLEVSLRGYHQAGDIDESYENRYLIINKLVEAGAEVNYCKAETKMTALHWLAYNNDSKAIQTLLKMGADHLVFSHDENLPIDVAGTTPSL